MSTLSQDSSVDSEGIIRLLIRRQIELNALLEITQAINNNFSAATLFKMYEFVLTQHLKVKDLCVLVNRNGVWEFVIANNQLMERINKEQLVDLLVDFKELTAISSPDTILNNFKYVIPVKHKEQALAYVLTGSYENIVDGLDKDMKFIETLTNVIVVAIENKKLFKEQIEQEKYKQELAFAQQVQSMLVPGKLPQNSYYALDAIYKPHSSIGGDYYDCIELNKEELIFCVGDVSGKGISAALLMANFQANLRALAQPNTTLTYLVQCLNKKVYENTGGDKFITFFIAHYNVVTKQLLYINAGHNAPLLINSGGVASLTEGCTILGAFAELPSITEGKKIIEANDILLCFTDGLVEGAEDFDNEIFDSDKLIDFIRDKSTLSAADFNRTLFAHFLGQYQSVSDDITLLSCKFF